MTRWGGGLGDLAAAALRSSAFAAALPFFGRFGPFEAASGIAAAPKGAGFPGIAAERDAPLPRLFWTG